MFKKNHRCNLLILNWSQEKNTLIWRIFLWNSWSIALLSKSRKMSKNKSNAPRIKSYCTIHTDTKYHKLVKVTTTNCSLVHKNRIYARDSQTIIHPLFCWFFLCRKYSFTFFWTKSYIYFSGSSSISSNRNSTISLRFGLPLRFSSWMRMLSSNCSKDSFSYCLTCPSPS